VSKQNESMPLLDWLVARVSREVGHAEMHGTDLRTIVLVTVCNLWEYEHMPRVRGNKITEE
jgi:hypothetical protein